MEQISHLIEVMLIGCRGLQTVCQATLGIDTDMSLHAEVSLIAFLLVHRGFPGKAALIFRKKYSESLNPYAMRFITLILLFTPSSTLVCIG